LEGETGKLNRGFAVPAALPEASGGDCGEWAQAAATVVAWPAASRETRSNSRPSW